MFAQQTYGLEGLPKLGVQISNVAKRVGTGAISFGAGDFVAGGPYNTISEMFDAFIVTLKKYKKGMRALQAILLSGNGLSETEVRRSIIETFKTHINELTVSDTGTITDVSTLTTLSRCCSNVAPSAAGVAFSLLMLARILDRNGSADCTSPLPSCR